MTINVVVNRLNMKKRIIHGRSFFAFLVLAALFGYAGSKWLGISFWVAFFYSCYCLNDN